MASPQFTDPQWEFLAVLSALGGSAPVDLIGALSPLPPGPLLDLVRRCEKSGLLAAAHDDTLTLGPINDPEALAKIKAFQQPGRLSAILDRLETLGLADRLNADALAGLLDRAGRSYDAAVLEYEKGREAVCKKDFAAGLNHLQRVVDLLETIADEPRAASRLLSAAMELSQLRFLVGQGIERVPALLEKARRTADRIGDRRSRSLIGLHQASFYFLDNRLDEALAALASELAEVEQLGDEDILEQSAEFFGLYHYLQGRYGLAVDAFERAVEASSNRDDGLVYWPVQVYLAYTSACLGRFHRAIGILDANRRRAVQNSQTALACYFRAILGVVLLMMNKGGEASYHLHGARGEALAHDNVLARNLCELALAYKDVREGRVREAYEGAAAIFSRFSEHGLRIKQYPTPHLLELLFAFHTKGYPPLPEVDFHEEMSRLLEGPNVHLQGVAYRFQALQALAENDAGKALQDLETSEARLIQSGDPVELGRTRVELARHYLNTGLRDEAGATALRAWEGLSGCRPDYFTADLDFLIGTDADPAKVEPTLEDAAINLFDLIQQLAPSPNLDELLGRLVEALNRFFRTERGGLFWFSDDKRKRPVLRAGRSLTEEDVGSENFRSALSRVFKSFRENRPALFRSESKAVRPAGDRPLFAICLPVEFQGRLRGVLYHDSIYLDHHGTFPSEALLNKLAAPIGGYVERIFEYGSLKEERDRLVSARRISLEGTGTGGILTQSREMERVLAEADRAAAAEATVLITGETGVGKELLAKRIHMNSPRAAGPFIVVDLASIPESLVESDLFGHEKGAFTGADSRRIGRLEMADKGSLFIDELGEIPLSIQVKLLRVLQEKRFCRLGGGRTISSDFRLVAATNRDLEKEVAAGRFRQDLYYRLNVIPLRLPPLRERVGDPVFLAKHFLAAFTQRFHGPAIIPTPEIEARLAAYHWPGNVRELINLIERAVLLSDGGVLSLNLPDGRTAGSGGTFEDSPTLDELQRRYIAFVLEKTGGRIGGPGGAAEWLGMKRTSLYARMKQLGLR